MSWKHNKIFCHMKNNWTFSCEGGVWNTTSSEISNFLPICFSPVEGIFENCPLFRKKEKITLPYYILVSNGWFRFLFVFYVYKCITWITKLLYSLYKYAKFLDTYVPHPQTMLSAGKPIRKALQTCKPYTFITMISLKELQHKLSKPKGSQH